MKKQFQKEEHNRRDKAENPEYLEKLRQYTPTTQNWSGVNMEKIQGRIALRDLEISKARNLYVVYGKWLYQHTKSLLHFSHLNAKHCPPDGPELESAFQLCQEKWNVDYPKIIRAIETGNFVRITGLPKGFQHIERLDWYCPDDVIADLISRKVPDTFRHDKATPKKSKGGTEPSKPAILPHDSAIEPV